jgi:hypothetical protein
MSDMTLDGCGNCNGGTGEDPHAITCTHEPPAYGHGPGQYAPAPADTTRPDYAFLHAPSGDGFHMATITDFVEHFDRAGGRLPLSHGIPVSAGYERACSCPWYVVHGEGYPTIGHCPHCGGRVV